MLYLTNSFSINMISENCDIKFTKISTASVQEVLTNTSDMAKNCIGHTDTDTIVRNILSQNLGNDIPCLPVGQRVSVQLTEDDLCIVAQYTGSRLPEGSTKLPEGAKIEFWLVEIQKQKYWECSCGYKNPASSRHCGNCGF